MVDVSGVAASLQIGCRQELSRQQMTLAVGQLSASHAVGELLGFPIAVRLGLLSSLDAPWWSSG